jgi:hypothetical protein
MAVGVTFADGEKERYYSIVRWGDAKLTLEQVKKKLGLEKVMSLLALVGVGLVYLAARFLPALF